MKFCYANLVLVWCLLVFLVFSEMFTAQIPSQHDSRPPVNHGRIERINQRVDVLERGAADSSAEHDDLKERAHAAWCAAVYVGDRTGKRVPNVGPWRSIWPDRCDCGQGYGCNLTQAGPNWRAEP